jgi:hypothetical protein
MTNPWKITSLALTAALALSLGAADTIADRQPLMRDALASLEVAETKLENAAHDKGGHRVKALDLTRKAIAEVKAGIEFDNRR